MVESKNSDSSVQSESRAYAIAYPNLRMPGFQVVGKGAKRTKLPS